MSKILDDNEREPLEEMGKQKSIGYERVETPLGMEVRPVKQEVDRVRGVNGRFMVGDPRINRVFPGPGRPRAAVKERLGREREKNIAFLCSVRDSGEVRVSDRLTAVITMLAYDIGKPAQVIEGDGEQLVVTVRTASGADPFTPKKTNDTPN